MDDELIRQREEKMRSILEFFKIKRRDSIEDFNRLRKDFVEDQFDKMIGARKETNRVVFTDQTKVDYENVLTLNVRLNNGLTQRFIGIKIGNANYIREHADGLPYDRFSELNTPILYFPGLKDKDNKKGTTLVFGIDDYAILPEGIDYPMTRERFYNIYSDTSNIADLKAMDEYSISCYFGNSHGAKSTTIGNLREVEQESNAIAVEEFIDKKKLDNQLEK